MRRLTQVLVLGLAACGSSPGTPPPQTFEFGPYPLGPGQEFTSQCVSATLNNEQPLYINAVELTTGPGFHHSNWFWVPDTMFAGPDGTWDCSTRGYDEATAGVNGGVLFAQSTQSTHEIQQFPAGVAVVIPPHSKILAGTHLLNSTDAIENVPLSLTITPIAEATTLLSGMSFTNESISLPPMRMSRMQMVCDIGSPHRAVLGRPPDFKVYYALAHYHALGRGLAIEAVKDDGTSTPIFTTANRIGDALGGTIDPGFSMAGYSKIRFYCDFDNPRSTAVTWGVGTNEMCVFLSFTDSEKTWGGGALDRNQVPTIVDNGTYVEATYPCTVFNTEPNR